MTGQERILKNIIRVGRISTVDAAACTARVVFSDKNSNVSYDLPVINRGSQGTKDYWAPEIDEQVLCIFLPNSNKGLNSGFILGSFFSAVDIPPCSDANIKMVKFADGSIVKNDGKGNISINAPGNISIAAGGTVTIIGASINLN